ncbi:PhoD-like phosphatase N-terminal domain-containing protein, partial [Klebsiella pneumoniae]
PGITRRSFLKGLGIGTASVGGLSLLQGCGSDNDSTTATDNRTTPSDNTPTQNVQFLHSVASGDPAFDSVVLWTRITPENTNRTVAGRVDVFKDEALTMFVKSMDFQTTAAQDFTVKLICNGLEQDTVYFYQFRSNGKTSPVGRTRTTPAAGNKRPLNFGVVSCSSLA